MDDLDHLYPAHFAELQHRAERAMSLCGVDALLIGSGTQIYHFLDDLPQPFRPNPLFRQWLPEVDAPDCWLAIRPGSKPTLVYCQ
ncbi:MAG: Xaa-Pro dipeptidase, partial [Xanthomonadales bacterium]|nr:Xaa-Pro dipeptidase [Xanthomonadales bacterium]